MKTTFKSKITTEKISAKLFMPRSVTKNKPNPKNNNERVWESDMAARENESVVDYTMSMKVIYIYTYLYIIYIPKNVYIYIIERE